MSGRRRQDAHGPAADAAPGAAAEGRRRPSRDADEALDRLLRHGRRAAGEALAALHAAVEVAAFASTGRPPEASVVLSPLAALLEGLAAELDTGPGEAPARTADAIALAVEAEIERWEARAADDPDARKVLRAFLGLREILWELGLRPGAAGPGPAPEPERSRPPRDAEAADAPRVQRVRVQG